MASWHVRYQLLEAGGTSQIDDVLTFSRLAECMDYARYELLPQLEEDYPGPVVLLDRLWVVSNATGQGYPVYVRPIEPDFNYGL